MSVETISMGLKNIYVLEVSNRLFAYTKRPVHEQEVTMDKSKNITFTFTSKQVGLAFIPNILGIGRWRRAVMWRVGSNTAMDWEPSENKDFIPLLTQEESAAFVQKQVAKALGRAKLLTNEQFILLAILIGVVLVVQFIILAGIHIHVTSKLVLDLWNMNFL